MDLAYKFYFCTFKNNVFTIDEKYRWDKYGEEKLFGKFGITHNTDVLSRFDPDVNNGYAKSEKYADWDIDVEFSMWFETKEEAEAYEKYWLEEVFPKTGYTKVWVEKVLGCPTMDYYTEATGITELRLITDKQRRWILRQMYTKRDEYNAESV